MKNYLKVKDNILNIISEKWIISTIQKTKIIRRFVTLRLKIHSKKADENANNVTYASKTMAMHIRTEKCFF